MPVLHRIAARGARLLPRSVQLGLYKVPVLSGAVRWLLSRGAEDRPVLATVVSGPLRGASLYVNLRSEKYYWLGTYEAGVQAVACREIGAGDVVYDVGAHRGFFSVLFSILVGPGGEVHCFEPVPENREVLERQRQANALETVIKVVPAAVTSETGTARFLMGNSSSTGRLVKPQSDQRTISVRTITLDDYVAQGNGPPDVIKMDVEGAETDAIRGMSETLRRHKPKLIIEFHSDEAKRSVWEVLAAAGYTCFVVGRTRKTCHDPCNIKDRRFLFTASESAGLS